MIKPLGTIAAAVLVTATLVPTTATAKTIARTIAQPAVNCSVSASSITAAGDHDNVAVVSTTPPGATKSPLGRGAFTAGQVKDMATMAVLDDGFGGYSVYGYVIIGDSLYQATYSGHKGTADRPAGLRRIGGGWGKFTMVEEAEYQGPTQAGISRWTVYALRNDGVLFRWTVSSKGVWRSAGSAPGFAAVTSMALVSKAATYDTFVANARGGALYTIHIPTSAPMKPVVKQVRSRTWQGFETLLAQKCGAYGTVLLGIDKDTGTAYLYAVGRFTGTSTVIRSLGKVPATFPDTVYARIKDPGAPLNGE
ncbi:hypothetical protein JOF29_006419 [Kribbella aluminosa]|uniref:Uncharacterized protein n=1 Tax=Kribbella aluminosa TaxID=416017 RepID=A0ABS4UUI9_9ACTN|nr:hypothetical protein [Kribbella aluminosa]MBP2355309.1 hypothetical protein [Kribbella aluminosa]